MANQKRTYISLFSGAGIGCYGFKLENFECIATNELLDNRMAIQKANKKCKYDSGYIAGDVRLSEVKEKIFNEIEKWKINDNLSKVDVIVATPPCQGMSTANYKKSNEQSRNSLVVNAIQLIKQISPNIFVFENVRAFMKTLCTDLDGKDKTIEDSIFANLSDEYNIFYKVINFKDYGVASSRPRTIVIGTSKKLLNVSPLNLFPIKKEEITVREAIGHLKKLGFAEKDEDDIYHRFREYPKYMEEWIECLKEGESAFQNEENKKPYKMVDGERQLLRSGHLGNKFRRLFWDRSGACINTRNDQLASQDTIHPADNRVLSIRELMLLMSIPNSFKWTNEDVCKISNKELFLKRNELNIRRCIGEAVPTEILRSIAKNINDLLDFEVFFNNYKECDLENHLKNSYFDNNFYIYTFLEEERLADKKATGSFYTPQSVVFHALKNFKLINMDKFMVLEPAVGLGAFIPQLVRLLDDCKDVQIDAIDIDKQVLAKLEKSLEWFKLPQFFSINYINCDFLKYEIEKKYDLIVTNPPYGKPDTTKLNEYRNSLNCKSSNLFDFFMQKIKEFSTEIICVIPKSFLMAADYATLREMYQDCSIVAINDFGVKFFKKVFVEIISIHFKAGYNKDVLVENLIDQKKFTHVQKYIFHTKAWLIYRDKWFDEYIDTLILDYFNFFRDRQITNKYLQANGKIRVLKSKNILDSGEIINIEGYDAFIDSVENFAVSKFLNQNCIIMPSFTYNTRATILPPSTVTNGSIAVLTPKNSDADSVDLSLYATENFRKYYAIVKNFSRFTLNIDSSSIYYIGVIKLGKRDMGKS